MRTIMKTALSYVSPYGQIVVPVHVYKMSNDMRLGGVEFHLCHVDCGNRVRYRYFCEHCGAFVERSDITKMVDVGGEYVPVDREAVEAAANQNENITIIGVVPMRDIIMGIDEGTISFVDHYCIAPFDGGKRLASVVKGQLDVIFAALKKNNQALYVTVPLSGGERHALIFPSANMYTIRYAEEIRERKFTPDGGDKKMVAELASLFKKIEVAISAPSAEPIIQRVNAVIPVGDVEAVRRDDMPESFIDIGGFMEKLKDVGKKKGPRAKTSNR